MSLAKLLAGRKRDSLVWEYFAYDEATGKSTCQVIDAAKEKICGTSLTGKNTSNLVSHLQRFHKEEYSAYAEGKKRKQTSRQGQGVKRKAEDQPEDRRKMQTIESCIQRRVVSWAEDSTEHKERLRCLMDMIVDTNLPLSVVDRPSFRKLLKKLDGKFQQPGMLNVITIFNKDSMVQLSWRGPIPLQLVAGPVQAHSLEDAQCSPTTKSL